VLHGSFAVLQSISLNWFPHWNYLLSAGKGDILHRVIHGWAIFAILGSWHICLFTSTIYLPILISKIKIN